MEETYNFIYKDWQELLAQKPLYYYENKNAWENELLNKMLYMYNKDWEKENYIYRQKKIWQNYKDQIQKLEEMLHDFNKMYEKRNTLEYKDLKNQIKKLFFALENNPVFIEDYFKLHFMYKNVQNQNKENTENKETDQNRLNKGKKIEQVKKPKLHKTSHKKKNIIFPFLNEKECKEKNPQKPTFVKKEDMVRILERLGYQNKLEKGMTLNKMTKDQLCALYFRE